MSNSEPENTILFYIVAILVIMVFPVVIPFLLIFGAIMGGIALSKKVSK